MGRPWFGAAGWPRGPTGWRNLGSVETKSPLELTNRTGSAMKHMKVLMYLNGKAYHGLDQYHRFIHLQAGPSYRFAAGVWTSVVELEWQPSPVFRLVRLDLGVSQRQQDE